MSSLTKIFIVLTLVFSLVVAVMLVTFVARQDPIRSQLEAERTARVAAQSMLLAQTNEAEKLNQEIQRMTLERTQSASKQTEEITRLNGELANMKIDKDTLDSKNSALGSNIAQLTAANDSLSKQLEAKNADNARLAPENVRLIQANAELSRKVNEDDTAIKFADEAIRKLQEQLNATADNAPKGGASTGVNNEAGTVAQLSVQTPAEINGKITEVKPTPGRILVELPLGSRDGVRKGTVFYVYRGQNYIADAVVENVTPAQSVAAVDPSKVKAGESVKAGDMVISGTK